MYSYINHKGELAHLKSGYLVRQAGTESKYERTKSSKLFEIIKEQTATMSDGEYLLLNRSSNTVTRATFFAFGEDACKHAKATGQKRYLNLATWQNHAVSLRQAIWDLLTQ